MQDHHGTGWVHPSACKNCRTQCLALMLEEGSIGTAAYAAGIWEVLSMRKAGALQPCITQCVRGRAAEALQHLCCREAGAPRPAEQRARGRCGTCASSTCCRTRCSGSGWTPGCPATWATASPGPALGRLLHGESLWKSAPAHSTRYCHKQAFAATLEPPLPHTCIASGKMCIWRTFADYLWDSTYWL